MKKHKMTEFSGEISYVSCSPHGDPEGVVLDDGSFIKIPPHSLLNKDLIQVGTAITGTGEVLTEEPNAVIHHVKILKGKKVLADDSMDKESREELKEKHKEDLESRKDAPSKKITLQGIVVAIATKPKGEVDRMIFEDGTSIHIPKEIEITSDEIELGSMFEVVGQARIFETGRFIKAEKLHHA